MMYFCVENDILISVLDYEPTVPQTVTVVRVKEEYVKLLESKTHYFDPTKKKIVKYNK